MDRQLNGIDTGDMAPSQPMVAAWTAACSDFKSALGAWNAINAKNVVAFNALLAQNNIKPVPVVPAQVVPICALAPLIPGRGGDN